MTIRHTITRTWAGAGGQISKASAYTGEQEQNLDFTIAASTTNQQRPLSFTLAALKSLFVSSDQPVTLKTNSSSSPANTISILAGEPFMATGTSGDFSVDVTTVFFTNATASPATVQIRCLC